MIWSSTLLTHTSKSSLPDEATADDRQDGQSVLLGADARPSRGRRRSAMPTARAPAPQEPADIVAAYREAMRELTALRQERAASARKARAERGLRPLQVELLKLQR